MSEISSANRMSGANGTATVQALEKTSTAGGSIQAKDRQARIAELREQYESGKYEVESAKVSSAIVGQHLNVLA